MTTERVSAIKRILDTIPDEVRYSHLRPRPDPEPEQPRLC